MKRIVILCTALLLSLLTYAFWVSGKSSGSSSGSTVYLSCTSECSGSGFSAISGTNRIAFFPDCYCKASSLGTTESHLKRTVTISESQAENLEELAAFIRKLNPEKSTLLVRSLKEIQQSAGNDDYEQYLKAAKEFNGSFDALPTDQKKDIEAFAEKQSEG